MRPLYLLLKFSLNVSLRLFYKRFIVLNTPKQFFGSTIYVSNHPNSFMDPILIGGINRPIVHFMTRSDVFKWWLKPILWAAHMLPIYRQHDGQDTKGKNSDVFKKVNRSLALGRNILIFGEGFTDDVPVRSLKPVKKGPIRMGFHALEANQWKKKIYVAALGVSYTDRNTVGSEFVLNNGKRICLNDYKEAYLENSNKVTNELTKILEQNMQECIVYVKEKSLLNFVENVMRITRKGYNHQDHDDSIPLLKRYQYSQQLAHWVNHHVQLENEEFAALNKDLEAYFSLEKRMKIQDRFVAAKSNPRVLTSMSNWLYLFFMLPFAVLGYLLGTIPYLGSKKLTEKIMRRKVFWGSVKMMIAKLFGLLLYVPILIFVSQTYLPHWSLGILAFFAIPVLWRISYGYTQAIIDLRLQRKMKHMDLSNFVKKRKDLEERIARLIPVA